MSGHLASLEAESIEILRDAVALAEKPVMMYSIGKDSSVMTPSGAQGILAGDSAVSPAACRHHLEIPRDDCVPRQDRCGVGHETAGAHQPSGDRRRS